MAFRWGRARSMPRPRSGSSTKPPTAKTLGKAERPSPKKGRRGFAANKAGREGTDIGGRPMKPARFDYVLPATVDAAIEALVASNGEGKLLAGGQSLLPLLNFRMARPAVLVDLNGIKGLSYIEARGNSIVI